MPFLNIFSKASPPTEKPKPKIAVDNREKNSLVPSELVKLGMQIEFQHLQVADYLVNNTAVERKTFQDFQSSIINKRILSQLKELKQYPSQILLIEGMQSQSFQNSIMHENALRGFILSVLNNFKVPILFTQNEKDTAKYLAILANKKQNPQQSIRASKILMSCSEQAQFVLEGFPGIGPASAKKLITEFKSLKNIFSASKEDLEKVIGKKSDNFLRLLSFESQAPCNES